MGILMRERDPTVRQREMIKLFADGLTRKEIAVILHVSENTVRQRTKEAGNRLGMHRMPAIVAACLRRGYIQ